MLNIFQPKMQLAVCSDCHKLHNVKNIVEYKEEGKTAIAHEEFLNNSVPVIVTNAIIRFPSLKKRKMEQLLYLRYFILNQVFVNN